MKVKQRASTPADHKRSDTTSTDGRRMLDNKLTKCKGLKVRADSAVASYLELKDAIGGKAYMENTGT